MKGGSRLGIRTVCAEQEVGPCGSVRLASPASIATSPNTRSSVCLHLLREALV